MMKSVAAGVLLLAGTMFAAADEKTVIEEHSSPGVVIEHDRPAVVEKRVERHGDCDSKTVHKEGVEGSTTVHKERCD
jgi:hypothetical protein